MSYFPSLGQNTIAVPSNSSVADIAGGATFTGTSFSTATTNSIVVSFVASQNCTVFIDQSSNGTNWDISDSYNFNVLKGNFGVAVKAVAAFFRVRVTNVTASNATGVRLASGLIPVNEPQPRSLDAFGNFKTSVNANTDTFGNTAENSPTGTQAVHDRYKLVGTTFGASIDTNFWTASNTGAGSASGVATGFATMTSGTANSGFGSITTVRQARFVSTIPNKFRSVLRITALSIANNTRRWGAFTTTGSPPTVVNGYYYELSGTNVLSVNSRNNGGTVNSIANGAFNGTVSQYTMDQNAHIYEITYFTDRVQFIIDGVLVHTMVPTTTLLSATQNLPVTVTSVNSAGGTASGTAELWTGAIVRLGMADSASKFAYIHGAVTAQVLKTGPGKIQRLIDNGGTGTSVTLFDAVTATNTFAIMNPRATSDYPYELDFQTGLTITTVGGTIDITIIYE
jgi:hypothetical protein